jgi:uncharacterized protein
MIKSPTYQIHVTINENGFGSFSLTSQHNRLAVVTVSVDSDQITVYRIKIFTRVGVKKVARILLGEVVEYARVHVLKVVTIARYARNQFSKHPMEYADLWEKNQ